MAPQNPQVRIRKIDPLVKRKLYVGTAAGEAHTADKQMAAKETAQEACTNIPEPKQNVGRAAWKDKNC